MSNLNDHLNNVLDHVQALSATASGLQDQVQEVFPPADRPAMAERMSFGLHSPSHYIHEIKDLTEKVTHMGQIIVGLKRSVGKLTKEGTKLSGEVSHLTEKVTGLEGKVTGLEGKVSHLTGELSKLKNDAVGKAKDIEHSVVAFWGKMKEVAEDLSLNSPNLKAFKALMESYFDIAMNALKALLKALGSDIKSLVDTDRLKKILQAVGSIFEYLPKLGGMVLTLIEDAAGWGKTALEHLQGKWKSQAVTTKTDFLTQLGSLKSTLGQISSQHLKMPLNTLFDEKAFDSATELMSIIPESLWHKATSLLQLPFFSELSAKATELLTALQSGAKQKATEAMAIFLALCKSFKSWLRLTRSTFKIQINGKLLDYLKAKITGGGDFGAADADVDSDAGTGLTLGVDVYSISGTVAGVALLIVGLAMAVIHFLVAIY